MDEEEKGSPISTTESSGDDLVPTAELEAPNLDVPSEVSIDTPSDGETLASHEEIDKERWKEMVLHLFNNGDYATIFSINKLVPIEYGELPTSQELFDSEFRDLWDILSKIGKQSTIELGNYDNPSNFLALMTLGMGTVSDGVIVDVIRDTYYSRDRDVQMANLATLVAQLNLKGYCSDFAMEFLSSVQTIVHNHPEMSTAATRITTSIAEVSDDQDLAGKLASIRFDPDARSIQIAQEDAEAVIQTKRSFDLTEKMYASADELLNEVCAYPVAVSGVGGGSAEGKTKHIQDEVVRLGIGYEQLELAARTQEIPDSRGLGELLLAMKKVHGHEPPADLVERFYRASLEPIKASSKMGIYRALTKIPFYESNHPNWVQLGIEIPIPEHLRLEMLADLVMTGKDFGELSSAARYLRCFEIRTASDLEAMAEVSSYSSTELSDQLRALEISQVARSLYTLDFVDGDRSRIRSWDKTEIQLTYAACLGSKKYEVVKKMSDFTGKRVNSEIVDAAYMEVAADQKDPLPTLPFMTDIALPESDAVKAVLVKRVFDLLTNDFGMLAMGLDKPFAILAKCGITQFKEEEVSIILRKVLGANTNVSVKKGMCELVFESTHQTHLSLSDDWYRKEVFEAEFTSELPFPIPTHLLDELFISKEPQILDRLLRAYRRSKVENAAYFADLLEKIKTDNTIPDEKRLSTLTVLLPDYEKTSDTYSSGIELIQKLVTSEEVTEEAGVRAYLRLIGAGDSKILTELTKITKELASTREEIAFTKEQRIALTVLVEQRDLASVQLVASVLKNGSIPQEEKEAIFFPYLNTLNGQVGRAFFDYFATRHSEATSATSEKVFDWTEFGYIASALSISNKALLDEAVALMKELPSNTFDSPNHDLFKTGFHDLKMRYPSMPDSLFLHALSVGRLHCIKTDDPMGWAFVAFCESACATTQSSKQHEAIVGSVVGMGMDKILGKRLVQAISAHELKLKTQTELVQFNRTARLLRAMAPLFTSRINAQSTVTDEERQEMFDCVETKRATPSEYFVGVEDLCMTHLQKIITHPDLTSDRIEGLIAQWGSIEPIITYASRLQASDDLEFTNSALMDLLSHIDTAGEERWKAWRYDEKRQIVQDQIGLLEPEARKTWATDHALDLGSEVVLGTDIDDAPRAVRNHVIRALRSGHIVMKKPDELYKVNKALVDLFIPPYGSEILEEAQLLRQIREHVVEFDEELHFLDACIAFQQLERVQTSLETWPTGGSMRLNTKTADTITFLAKYLPPDSASELKILYQLQKDSVKPDELSAPVETVITKRMREQLLVRIEEIRATYISVIESRFAEHYAGLSHTSIASEAMAEIGKRRRDVAVIRDICRLLDLSPSDIIPDSKKKSDGAQTRLVSPCEPVIARLRSFFKGNETFLQDLGNVEKTVQSAREGAGRDRHYCMFMTDNPQVLLQIGKYPLGNKSCQNYEGDTDYSKSLISYMGDAHIKVACLIDVNKLSRDELALVIEQGFEAAFAQIPTQHLLEAMVGRSIVKIGSAGGKPALFLEPGYTTLNKKDDTVNRFFEVFAERALGAMGLPLLRGGDGGLTITIPASSNPSGQYEDGEFGNAQHGGLGIQIGSYEMPARYVAGYTPLDAQERALAESLAEAIGETVA